MKQTPYNFEIKFAYAAWVPPFKSEEEDSIEITSKLLDSSNNALSYFKKIFDESISNCKIEILFKSNDSQENEIRKSLMDLIQTNQHQGKKKIADLLSKRLAKLTDNRNGTGLFVIIEGRKAETTRLLLNRFREDEVVFSGVEGRELNIQLLTQAFSKKSRYYKLAVYEDIFSERSFWKGFAIDKQKNSGSIKEISDYWIKDFLLCDLAVNSIQGTKSFSKVIKNILRKTDSLDEKEMIISAILLLKNRTERYISVEAFCDNYLNEELKAKIRTEMNDNYTFQSMFEIDSETYTQELGSKITTLNNGVIVSAPTFLYDEYVKEEELEDGRMKLIVEGIIEDKKLNRVTK